MDEIGDDAGPLIERAIYLRGLFITRFAGAELALGQILVSARLHPAYKEIPLLPFALKKVIKLVRTVALMDGPIRAYQDRIEDSLRLMEDLQEDRDFMVHAIFGPDRKSPDGIRFRMYRRRGEEIEYGTIDTNLPQLEALAAAASPLSSGLCKIAAEISRKYGIGSLPPHLRP